MKAAVLTVSDGVHHGTREDRSGDTLDELLRAEGFEVARRVVPGRARRRSRPRSPTSPRDAALVLTTGGTGFAPRDVTPEATLAVIDREAPGIAEAIRADAARETPHALLSRGVAGLRRRRPSSSTCPARRVAAATATRCSGPRSRTGSSSPRATRASRHRQT